MKTKKLITEELIDKKLIEKGIKFEVEHDEALEVIQQYYDFEITDHWNRTPDYSIYT